MPFINLWSYLYSQTLPWKLTWWLKTYEVASVLFCTVLDFVVILAQRGSMAAKHLSFAFHIIHATCHQLNAHNYGPALIRKGIDGPERSTTSCGSLCNMASTLATSLKMFDLILCVCRLILPSSVPGSVPTKINGKIPRRQEAATWKSKQKS